MFDLTALRAAHELVAQHVPPTPQYAWPLLNERVGHDVWVKHENHTRTGAFKVRGGLVYLDALMAGALGGAEGAAQGVIGDAKPNGVISATRGNHGQSIAYAARAAGLACVIVVPQGNSVEKNAAMRSFGAELIEAGADFDESKHIAADIARERGLHFVPSFHPALIKGVATYALELFNAVEALDVVYVPVGLGSGICGLITARDLLGLETQIVGVVAEGAPAVALSFEAGQVVPTNSARTFADGIACRDPDPDAMAMIQRGAARIVTVSDAEIAEAVRIYYQDTHNLAEGAGAAPLAGLLKERAEATHALGPDGKAAVILCGGNIDTPLFAKILDGQTPA
ncbi:MAG: threonine dehydratase [Pseudomonadota bacterium]